MWQSEGTIATEKKYESEYFSLALVEETGLRFHLVRRKNKRAEEVGLLRL